MSPDVLRIEIEKAPGWVKDHLEGLDWLNKQRELETIETRFPGLSRAFEQVIELMPTGLSHDNTEFPFAAGVAMKNEDGKLSIVALAHNNVNRDNDSTAHAEMQAIRIAQAKLGKHLTGAVLLSTAEPCAMCCGAGAHTDVSTVVYGLDHDDIKGKHALVGGEYKPFRVSPDGFEADTYLTASGIEVVSGFIRDRVLQRMQRTTGSWASYYRDPDA